MNFYAISALVNLLSSLILGVLVLVRKDRKRVHYIFAVFASSVIIWSLGYLFWQNAVTQADALFWSRFFMAGAIFIPVTYLHFVLALVGREQEKRKSLAFAYLVFLLFFISNFTPLFIDHVEQLLTFPFWPLPGPVYHVFLVTWFLYVIYASYLLYNKYSSSKGIIRQQIKYVFWGMVIGFAAGSTNYFLWYRIPIPPIANILVSIYVASMAYAIIKHRLMDIRIVARRVFIYFGVAAFAYGMFYLIAYVYERFFGGVFTPSGYIAGVFIAPAFVYTFFTVSEGLRSFANKYFFAGLYNYQQTINKLAQELNYYNELDKIINSVISTIATTMQLDHVNVVLTENDDGSLRVTKSFGPESKALEIMRDPYLLSHVRAKKSLIIREELISDAEETGQSIGDGIIKLNKRMFEADTSIIIPLQSGDKVVGMATLGTKISGDPYTQDDIDLLNTLCYQAGIAIDNARLYDELKDFNTTLNKRVEEQTSEIRNKNIHLEKLLNMKREFLDVASHQLRTPVSVILGVMSMFKEGSMKNVSEEQRDKFIDSVYHKAQKLANIINDFLSASEMDTGEPFQIDGKTITKIDLIALVEKTVQDLQPLVIEKHLVLKVVRTGDIKKLTIDADTERLEQAIANLVDNAIKYTKQGQVRVVLSQSDDRATIDIEDSGIGIPEEDKLKIFEKFSRASNATNAYTDGSGLGLFIAKGIVEAHKGGQISFKSEEGKGSTFTISLPLSK